jgi:hypothetical protein
MWRVRPDVFKKYRRHPGARQGTLRGLKALRFSILDGVGEKMGGRKFAKSARYLRTRRFKEKKYMADIPYQRMVTRWLGGGNSGVSREDRCLEKIMQYLE